MIVFKDINFQIGERNLFENLSLTLSMHHRYALVGRNGEGKTTLLRLITKELSPSSGLITVSNELSIGYLPQDLIELGDDSVATYIQKKCHIYDINNKMRSIETQLSSDISESEREKLLKKYAYYQHQFEHLDAYSFDARMKEILLGLGFSYGDENRSCNEFSGGWKMRIFLAQLLMQQVDILLMDEPTNHLDTESLEWLEQYLLNYKGLLIVISHDRYFLDRVVHCTLELESGHIAMFPGTYTHYLNEKEKRKALISKESDRIEKQIRQTEIFIERFRYKATKSTQVQSRIKALEKLKAQCPEKKKEKRHVRIKLSSSGRSHQEVIRLDNVSHSYGEKEVIRDLNISIQRNDRIALVGKNGSGKSTLSRLISAKELPTKGCVHIAEHTEIGFFAQESMQNLNYSHNVIQELMSLDGPLKEFQLRDLLGAFLFSGDDIYKPVRVLSGGEKSRLALCKIMSQPFKVLVLDEPTNHLDEATKEAFHNALSTFDGTLVLVSHDRYFLDRLVTRVLEIHQGKVSDYCGNYSYFIEQRKLSLVDSIESNKIGTTIKVESKRDEDKQRKREEALLRKNLFVLKKKCEDIEESISNYENQKKACEIALCNPDIYQEPEKIKTLKQQIATIEMELGNLFDEWNIAIERVESF